MLGSVCYIIRSEKFFDLLCKVNERKGLGAAGIC